MHNLAKPMLAIGSPLLFAFSGAIGRLTFQLVETRYQIVTFILLAMALEMFAERRRASPAILRAMVNAGAATAAIVAMKWHLEGVSPLLLRLVA